MDFTEVQQVYDKPLSGLLFIPLLDFAHSPHFLVSWLSADKVMYFHSAVIINIRVRNVGAQTVSAAGHSNQVSMCGIQQRQGATRPCTIPSVLFCLGPLVEPHASLRFPQARRRRGAFECAFAVPLTTSIN